MPPTNYNELVSNFKYSFKINAKYNHLILFRNKYTVTNTISFERRNYLETTGFVAFVKAQRLMFIF